MDGKDILQKYRPVIHEMMRDVAENSIPYITVTAVRYVFAGPITQLHISGA